MNCLDYEAVLYEIIAFQFITNLKRKRIKNRQYELKNER